MARKKLIAVMTALALACSGMTVPTVSSQAATTLKIKNVTNGKKTIYTGKSFTIKTNLSTNKLTFKSSKTSIATVSKKGVIKAKKKGSCVISVTGKISSKKKLTKKIKLTVKKSTTKATAAPVSTNTAGKTPVPVIVATARPSTTEAVGNNTTTPDTTEAVQNSQTPISPEPTNAPAETPLPYQPQVPENSTVPASSTPDASDSPTVSQSPLESATPSATATAAPAVTGTIFVTSLTFSDSGVILQDEAGNNIAPEDASNLYVTDSTCVTIVAPTNDTVNAENDKEISVSGSCQNGQIIVDVDKTTYPHGKAELSFAGLTLANTNTSPVYVAAIADECVISIKKGTENVLSDGANYTNADQDTGVIYSKDDLKIKGKGTLTVNGNCGYGIISKDDLKIYNGTIRVTSKDACLKGKDSVKIGDKDDLGKEDAYADLALTLNSTLSDGIRSNNPIDDTALAATDDAYADGKAAEIVINGGTITIDSYGDGIQSNGSLTVNGGTLDISTYEGSSYSNQKDPSQNWGGMPGNTNWGTGSTSSSSDVSAKGLKAEGDLTLNNGTITFDTSDDGIHCGSNLVVNGGSYTIATGDDGLHSDKDLTVNGGTITITKSYEGIEGTTITINDGTIKLTSSDDGFNASDGSSTANDNGNGGNSMWDRPGGGRPNSGGTAASSTSTNCTLTINGGFILVDALGDGLDSNGSMYVNGGTTVVLGPTSGGDGTFDIGEGTGCVFSCTGGVLLGIGTTSMAINPTTTGNGTYLTGTVSSGSHTIAITGSDGNVVSAFQYNKQVTYLQYYNGTSDTYSVYLDPDTNNVSFNSYNYASSGTITGGTQITIGTGTGTGNNSPWGRW